MVSKLGLVGNHVFEPSLCNLHICFPISIFVSPKRLFAFVCLWACIYPHVRIWGCMCPHAREGIKEHDIHCKPKSYKLKFFRKIGSITFLSLIFLVFVLYLWLYLKIFQSSQHFKLSCRVGRVNLQH